MAYNRSSYLKTVIKVQDIYLKHKEPYVTNRSIFQRFVLPHYEMTETTFYNYLNVKNPKKQLETLKAKIKKAKENPNQLHLFKS
jgi:hypothetical protein